MPANFADLEKKLERSTAEVRREGDIATLGDRLIALVGAPSGALAQIGNAPAHTIVSSQEIKWSPGPASLAPGAEMAVLHGDPAKEGLFVMRLKFPKGYRIGPHTHPTMEAVTVISGALGMGETADLGKAQALPAG